MESLKNRLDERFNGLNEADNSEIRSYLGDLWFAVHGKETSKYGKLADKLDELGVSMKIQNAVSNDASQTTKKSIDTAEVQDRIGKILKNNQIEEGKGNQND